MRVCLHRLGNGAVVVNGWALGAAMVAIAIAIAVEAAGTAAGTAAVLVAVAGAGAAATAGAARPGVCKMSAANEHTWYSGFLGH
jgi:ribosomal protein S9